MALTQQAYWEKPIIKPKAYNFNIANALNKFLVSWWARAYHADAVIKVKIQDSLNEHTSCANTTIQCIWHQKVHKQSLK